MSNFVLVSPFESMFGSPFRQPGVNVRLNQKTVYTFNVPSSPSPPQQPPLYSMPDNLEPVIHAKVQVLNPVCFNEIPACNACMAFRGYFWESAKMVSDNMQFDLALNWNTRKFYPCENAHIDHDTLEKIKNPNMIFLEFLYTTDTEKEFRFGTHFDVWELIKKEQIQLTAVNNNNFTGNLELAAAAVPFVFNLAVSLKMDPQLAAAIVADTTPMPEIPHDTTMIQDSITIAEWIAMILTPILRQPTPFLNTRTLVRTPFVAPLFTNLPDMWKHPGSPLPYESAVYMFLHACLMNDLTENEIVNEMPKMRALTSRLYLRVTRDFGMVCFPVFVVVCRVWD